MAARWVSFLVWAAVVASLAFWVLRLLVPSTAAPPHTVTVSAAGMARGDLVRVLGADPPPQAAADAPAAVEDRRFQLIGVVAPRGVVAGGQGVALIAIDGKPPKAFRVGAAVDGDTVLQSVSARGASLGLRGGAATVSLATPPLPPPATGVLPPAMGGGQPSAPGRPVAPVQRPAMQPPPMQAPPVAAPPPMPAATATAEDLPPDRDRDHEGAPPR
jgi:general secretion pathway protein C